MVRLFEMFMMTNPFVYFTNNE